MAGRFGTIATHERPHLDEIVAIWLLRKFGEEMFPGVSTAKIIFWGNGGEVPDDHSVEDYEREGILLVGVGRGRFDEHPTINGKRKSGECTTTLVAKALGIDDDPSLKKIIEFVVNNDLKGIGSPFDLAYIVKVLHQQYPDNPKKVMEWATVGLEAKYQEQVRLWTTTKQEFERVAEVEEIRGPNGKMLKMATIVSSDEQMSKFARSVHGGRVAIIIQKCSSGNVQIYTNKQFGLKLYDVAQMVRISEQAAKGQVITSDWRTLASEGKVKGVEQWFFHHEGQMLLNGSLTAKDVPPTRLSLEQIQEIVQIGITDAFEPERAPNCKQGRCTSTPSNPCPWYTWGLHRCRKIRFEMRKK